MQVLLLSAAALTEPKKGLRGDLLAMKVRMTFAGVGVALAAASLTLAPIGAHAQGAGVVVFSGATGNLTPAVPLLMGNGTFQFSTANPGVVPGACADTGADLDETAGPDDTGVCRVDASGAYVNIVCGTGTATGSGTITPQPGLNGELITISAFTITFVGGQGVLTGTASDPDAGAGTAGGYVNIVPTGGTCATGVTQFTASGIDAVVAP